MRLCDPGTCEPLKAAVHGLMGACALLAWGYNSWAYGRRREPHLLLNSGIYALLAAWELARVRQHLDAR